MNLDAIVENLPRYLAGALTTAELLLISLLIGLLIAIPLGVLRSLPIKWLSRAVWVYTYVFRGTPMLVQLFLIYYGLAQFDTGRDSWAWPGLSSETGVRGSTLRLSCLMISAACAISRRSSTKIDRRRGSRFRKMFWATDSVGIRLRSWKIISIPSLREFSGEFDDMCSPKTSMDPSVGVTIPCRILSRVDLPAPFSPTSAWMVPGWIVRLTPRNACTPPNDFRTSLILTAATLSVID